MSKKLAQTRVIYIAGLYHSGSTLLDTVLGSQRAIIGLGEVHKAYYDGFEEFCSCGKSVKNCEFWSRIYSGAPSIHEYLESVLDEFSSLFGTENYLLDSSKCHPLPFNHGPNRLKNLPLYYNDENIDLYVIHLTRDPRSWTRNIIRRKSRFELSGIELIRFSLVNTILFRYIQWLYGHNKIMAYLSRNSVKNIRISYEDLSLDTEKTLGRISTFLDLPFDLNSDSYFNSKSHISVGNPSRFRNVEKGVVQYDRRWMSESPSLIEALIWRFFGNLIRRISEK